ncbi:M56 family metallopeptidase [Paenibacillus sp. GCM10027628]|uniref:M56 family metallopeptidase n=1 Tax=Paenibacillus sp. GCM10027628 TaxID=3273413 RepID=UPI00363FAF99
MNVKALTEQFMNLFDWVWSVSTMASILVVLIIALQYVLKRRLKPRWHYLMWLLVIVRLILPWSTESEFSIYNWIGFTDSIHSTVQVNQEEMLAPAVMQETALHSVYRYLFVVWLVGVSLLGTYTIRINRKFAQTMKNETVPITDPRVVRLFNQCIKRMSIHRPIALAQSRHLATPTLFGLVKPQLIMPQPLLYSLNDDQLQHVFLHELAHSKRNDIGVNWFMHVLLIIHWFNPVLWYAYRRMREDQEIASDALALSCLTPDKRQDYGYTLIKLLENFSRPVQVAGNVNLTGSKTQLQRRIKMIKQFKSNSYRWSFLGMATIIFISGCTLTSPKVSQTATQSPNALVSEEKPIASASIAPVPTTSDNKTDLAASIDSQASASNDKPKQTAPVESQPSAADDKSKPAASAGVRQPTAPDDKPRPVASTRELPAVSDDKPKPAPSTRVLPTASDDKPKPAPSTRVLPTASDDKPGPVAPTVVIPTAPTSN